MIVSLVLGILLGFVGSIPAAGPLLFLVIDAGISRDRSRALSLAVGGAIAEAVYVGLAFAGAGELLQLIPVSQRVLKLSSGVLVMLIGVWILRTRPGSASEKPARPSATALLTGLTLVLFNPGFLAFWSAVAAFIYSSGALQAGESSTAALALGSAVGIVLWFSSVYAVATRATRNVSALRLQALRRVLGGVLIALGAGLGVVATAA